MLLTIKNPLYPAKKRMRWYFVWASLVLMILLLTEVVFVYEKGVNLFTEANPKVIDIVSRSNRWQVILLFLILVFLFLGSYSSYKAYRSLSEPGLGQEVRRGVILRQIFFVMSTLVFNTPTSFIKAYIRFRQYNQITADFVEI